MKSIVYAGIAGLVCLSIARGGVINASGVVGGTTSADFGFATLSTPTSTLAVATQNGFTGIGVTGGAHPSQVDSAEKLVINFAVPMFVDEIQIGFLYNTGAAGDSVDERMQVWANGSLLGVLTATGATTATWTGFGSVSNVSPSQGGFGGVWRLTSPNDGNLVSSLELRAYPYNAVPDITDADFALISVTATPEPSAALLTGLGLVAFGLVRRRRYVRV